MTITKSVSFTAGIGPTEFPMIFYSQETNIGLLIASIPAILSVYLFFTTEKKNAALLLLMLSALLLRLLMISLDPFLHEWDEHFHALVAKNMMDHPLKPMLFRDSIFVHDVKDWSYSTLWLHKQPLFLWQMALSMKVFGVNELAMRLPSAIMSALTVWLTYDLARIWTKNEKIAFSAAALSCFSAYALELVSGRLSLEHNDTAFIFYMTLSFWCLLKYIESPSKLKWALWIGVAVGCAILNKWLTAYLTFGGWALYYLLAYGKKIQRAHLIQISLAFIVSIIIFLPWQLYISNTYPVESALGYKHNLDHMLKNLGHPGSSLYHIQFFPEAYHFVLIPFLLIGLVMMLKSKRIDKSLSVALLVMILVFVSFFSFIVATKMPTFPFAVSALIWTIIAIGYSGTIDRVTKKLNAITTKVVYIFTLFALAYLTLKSNEIAGNRSAFLESRNNRITNTILMKEMHDSIPARYHIFNFRSHQNIDFMFYRDGLGYHYYPDSTTVDSILLQGHRIAAIEYSDIQKLPIYIKSKPDILILKEQFK